MAQSLSRILMHLVFSTKNREPWICPAIRPKLLKRYGVNFDERYLWD